MNLSTFVSYFKPDGTPTDEGLKYFRSLEAQLAEFQEFKNAVAGLAAPSGGATQDIEARASISAIIAAG